MFHQQGDSERQPPRNQVSLLSSHFQHFPPAADAERLSLCLPAQTPSCQETLCSQKGKQLASVPSINAMLLWAGSPSPSKDTTASPLWHPARILFTLGEPASGLPGPAEGVGHTKRASAVRELRRAPRLGALWGVIPSLEEPSPVPGTEESCKRPDPSPGDKVALGSAFGREGAQTHTRDPAHNSEPLGWNLA